QPLLGVAELVEVEEPGAHEPVGDRAHPSFPGLVEDGLVLLDDHLSVTMLAAHVVDAVHEARIGAGAPHMHASRAAETCWCPHMQASWGRSSAGHRAGSTA